MCKLSYILFRMLGHPCSGQHPQPQLLPSVYQAALNHAGPYGHGRNVSHTPWEAVTFVAVSAVIVPAIFKNNPICLSTPTIYQSNSLKMLTLHKICGRRTTYIPRYLMFVF